MEKISIIKIGGAILSNNEKLKVLIDLISELDQKTIIVHGGGSIASDIARQMNVPVKMINGRRITGEKMLEIVTMVYGGLINKQLVAELQNAGMNAIGLSGADGNTIQGNKRLVKDIDYGFAGDIQQVNPRLLNILVDNNFIPVICPLIHNGKNRILNTNADTIASEISSELSKTYRVELLYCFDFPGVLSDPEDTNSKISMMNLKIMNELKQNGSLSNGIIPKLKTAFEASKKGVKNVFICHYNAILEPKKGTEICYQ